MAGDQGMDEARRLRELVAEINKLARQLQAMGCKVSAETHRIDRLGQQSTFVLSVEVLRPVLSGATCKVCEDGRQMPDGMGADYKCPACGGNCFGF